jgi:DNA-binding response OmpR family regulator
MPSTRLCDSLSDYPPFAGGTAIDNWPTLLVVDHDPEMLRALVFFFEKRGFHVAAASTVTEAKTLFHRRVKWTMVIADYHLPDGSGWELCCWVQDQPGNAATPFLLLSGNVKCDVICPDVDFLRKPFPIEELERRVRLALRLGQQG